MSHVLSAELGAVAFLDDERVLTLRRRAADPAHPLLVALDRGTGAVTRLDVGLRAESARPEFFSELAVSGHGELLVLSEDQGRRLRVIRCDPALRAFAR